MPFDEQKSATDKEILMNWSVVKGEKNKVQPSRTLFFALGKSPATEQQSQIADPSR